MPSLFPDVSLGFLKHTRAASLGDRLQPREFERHAIELDYVFVSLRSLIPDALDVYSMLVQQPRRKGKAACAWMQFW